jgi:hypothetical protein
MPVPSPNGSLPRSRREKKAPPSAPWPVSPVPLPGWKRSSPSLLQQPAMSPRWQRKATILHEFGRTCQDGRISGTKWNVAEIRAVTTGAVVRQALATITDWDWKQSRDSADHELVAMA